MYIPNIYYLPIFLKIWNKNSKICKNRKNILVLKITKKIFYLKKCNSIYDIPRQLM